MPKIVLIPQHISQNDIAFHSLIFHYTKLLICQLYRVIFFLSLFYRTIDFLASPVTLGNIVSIWQVCKKLHIQIIERRL
jgi:hypothetical protein